LLCKQPHGDMGGPQAMMGMMVRHRPFSSSRSNHGSTAALLRLVLQTFTDLRCTYSLIPHFAVFTPRLAVYFLLRVCVTRAQGGMMAGMGQQMPGQQMPGQQMPHGAPPRGGGGFGGDFGGGFGGFGGM
jgi:hypothetical protein